MGLLGLHLGAAEAEGEAEADVAAVGGALADGRVVGVEAAAAGADGAEHIVNIDEQRQATVEKVGTHAAVEGEIGVDLGQRRLGAAAIDGVGEELQAVKPSGRHISGYKKGGLYVGGGGNLVVRSYIISSFFQRSNNAHSISAPRKSASFRLAS